MFASVPPLNEALEGPGYFVTAWLKMRTAAPTPRHPRSPITIHNCVLYNTGELIPPPLYDHTPIIIKPNFLLPFSTFFVHTCKSLILAYTVKVIPTDNGAMLLSFIVFYLY